MAISKYNTPARATIRETQVLPDVGFMSQQVQRVQQQYDLNSQNLQATQGQLSGLTGYGKAANKYIRALDDKFGTLTQELIKKDLGDPRIAKLVKEEIYAIKNDPTLKTHIAAKTAFDEYQKKIAELSKDGNLPPGNLWEYKKKWEHYSKTGEFDPELTNPSISKGVDRIAEMDKLFNTIKASGGDTLASIESQAGSIYYKNGWKGVGGKQITGAIADNLDTIVNSPLGRELTKEFNMLSETGKAPASTAIDYIIKSYKAAGKRHMYSETTSGLSGALETKRKEDNATKKEEAYDGEGFMPAMTNGKKIDLDSDGRININPMYDMWDAITGGDSRSKEELELEKTLKAGAERSGVSVKDYVTKLNQDPNIKVSYYNTKKSGEISNRFFNPKTGGGDFWTRVVYTPEHPQGISAKEYMEEKELTPDDLKKGFTVIGDVSPDNQFTPKGYSAMIGGEPVIIDDQASLKDPAAIRIHQSNQAKYNGTGIHTYEIYNPGDKKTYRVTAKWDSKKDEITEDKQVIK